MFLLLKLDRRRFACMRSGSIHIGVGLLASVVSVSCSVQIVTITGWLWRNKFEKI
jgi:hypothetical protein